MDSVDKYYDLLNRNVEREKNKELYLSTLSIATIT
jgi:hypothetical protein